MGLLAPLYALAALAVIGPIIFHLIKRQPTGQVSSTERSLFKRFITSVRSGP